MSIVKGETAATEAARKHGLTIAEIERWQEQFLVAGENALRARPRDEEAAKDEQISRLRKKVGELVLDVDILKEAHRAALSGRRRQTSESRTATGLRRPRLSTACSAALEPARGLDRRTPAATPGRGAALVERIGR